MEVHDLIQYIVIFWQLLILTPLLYFVLLVIRYRKTLDSAGSRTTHESAPGATGGAPPVTKEERSGAGFADRGYRNALMNPARHMS